MLASLPSFVAPIDDSGALSVANIGRDIVLSDVYGLPPAFAYLAFKYTRNGNLKNAWPPSYAETALWIAAVALASTSAQWLPLLRMRGGAWHAVVPRPRTRINHPAMGLFDRFELTDDGDGISDTDEPLTQSERDSIFVDSLIFGLVSGLLLSLKDLPHNENLFSWIPWLLVSLRSVGALSWDL